MTVPSISWTSLLLTPFNSISESRRELSPLSMLTADRPIVRSRIDFEFDA